MSVKEVERVNHTLLQKTQSARKFYTPKDNVQDKSRYQAFDQTEVPFLGYQATVTYTFLDDRLFAYHLFAQDRDPDALDQAMQSYLIKAFGPSYTRLSDEGSLKMVWHFKERIINYWFFKESLSLTEKYSAAFGVLYLPIENSSQ